jgi:hypothetical protein
VLELPDTNIPLATADVIVSVSLFASATKFVPFAETVVNANCAV